MTARTFTEDDVRLGLAREVEVDGERRIVGVAFTEAAREAIDVLTRAGWAKRPQTIKANVWRRGSGWAHIRAGTVSVNATLTPAEARALAVLAELPAGGVS